jgi:hypothetical protein
MHKIKIYLLVEVGKQESHCETAYKDVTSY